MSIPRWLPIAEALKGQREVPGPASNSWIKSLWLSLPGGKWFWEEVGKGDDSKLAWCGAAMAWVFREAGFQIPKDYARARAWASWGQPLLMPVHGCIGVMSREGGGHVCLIVGETVQGHLLGLGGNQGDAFKVSAFPRDRFDSFRWPPGEPLPGYMQLAQGRADISTSEA